MTKSVVSHSCCGVDEVITCSYGCGDLGRYNGLGQEAVYLVTGPRRCRRLPAGPPGGSRPLPALEAAARPTGPGGNQVAVLARSQGGGQGQQRRPLGFPRLAVRRCYRLGGAMPGASLLATRWIDFL
jgi:hypothetical protein